MLNNSYLHLFIINNVFFCYLLLKKQYLCAFKICGALCVQGTKWVIGKNRIINQNKSK